MKELGKLSINPEKLMKNEELMSLRGGYGGYGGYDNGACGTCGFDTTMCRCSSSTIGAGIVCLNGGSPSAHSVTDCHNAYMAQNPWDTYVLCVIVGSCNEVTDPGPQP